MNVYEKLRTVQSKLKAPKGQYNTFGKYSYRSCEDIQEAVKPILAEVSAVVITGDELLQVGDRYYVKATASFVDCESGEAITNTAFAREEESKKGMDASQVTGSTSSYARKYALNGLLCIDDVKDADTQDNSGTKKTGPGAEKVSGNKAGQPSGDSKGTKVTAAMIATVRSQVEKYGSRGLKLEKILATYKIADIADMTVADFKDCMGKLKLYENGGEKRE